MEIALLFVTCILKNSMTVMEAVMKHALVVNGRDNVANALDDIKKGVYFSFQLNNSENIVKAIDDIKFGFKVAIKPIVKSENIIKYGCVIGAASTDIQPGQCVHIHNVEGTRGRGDKGEA